MLRLIGWANPAFVENLGFSLSEKINSQKRVKIFLQYHKKIITIIYILYLKLISCK